MYFYAQFDSNGIVHSITQHLNPIEDSNAIQINDFDFSLIGKQYDSTNNTFNDAPLTLDEVKKEKLTELQQKYLASFTTFQSSALGTVKTYPIDSIAQANFKDLQDRLIADPNKNSFWFKTLEDGTLVQHNREQFLQLLEDAEMFKVNKILQFDAYEAQIMSAEDIATVDSITISFT